MTPERLAEIRAVNRSMRFVNAEHVKSVIVELADALEASLAHAETQADWAVDAECRVTEQRERAERAEAELAFQRKWCADNLGLMPPTREQNDAFLAALDDGGAE